MKTLKLIILVIASIVVSACITEGDVKDSKPTFDPKILSANSAERAVSYMRLNQLETAEDILKKALQKEPRNSVLNYTKAILKLRLGEKKQAEKHFRIAVKSNPNNSRAAHDFGFYLCGHDQRTEGIKMFDLAISNPLFQERSLSQLRAGECIFKENKNLAERYFLTAYDQNKNLSIALFRLAELYFTRQENLKARAFYQRYASVQPDTAASLYLAYQIEKVAGSEREAVIHRKILLEKFPGSNEAKQVRSKYKK